MYVDSVLIPIALLFRPVFELTPVQWPPFVFPNTYVLSAFPVDSFAFVAVPIGDFSAQSLLLRPSTILPFDPRIVNAHHTTRLFGVYPIPFFSLVILLPNCPTASDPGYFDLRRIR